MTSDHSAEEKLLEGSYSHEPQEEEEEEALSLCDMPLNLIEEENDLSTKEPSQGRSENDEEFNFGSWVGSVSTQSEMCAADEVFFKGQILPLRLSVSSDSCLISNRTGCLSRSESMDHSSSIGGSTSINSSRSSSSRSHFSSSSSSSSTINTARNSRPRIRNQFHTYPSPKPQIRLSNARPGSFGNSRSQKSTVWDLFRLGLVRAPEIELQDLKLRNNNMGNRNSVSRNSSSGSSSNSNSSSSVKNYSLVTAKNQQESDMDKQRIKKQSNFRGLFSDCKCSITAVETVPLNNIVIIKSGNDGSSGNKINGNDESVAVHGVEKRLQELKIKKKTKEKQQHQQKGKQAMSRHRTFEWLKELSHASFVDANLVDS